MNIGTSLKTISKNQLCSFIGTGGYVELAENDVLSNGSIVTAAAMLPLLNSRNDKGDGILPPGYQKVEFLAASGSQYILLPERFNFGQDPETNSGILLKTSDYETKATNYAFYVPVSTSAGSMPKSAFYIGRRSANASIFRAGLNGVYGLGEPYIDGKVYAASINFLNSGVIEVGEQSQNIVYNPTAYAAAFRILRSGTVCRLHEAHTSSGEEPTHSLIPALDPAGEPCMFDTVTKQPFYNDGTGSFRVGIATLQQVRELQLPDNTGNAVRTLYVSLPQEARTDFTAQKHLDYLTSLNWSLNVQYRDGDIPADYTKVDFLKSSGSQYIDTGVVTDGNYTISCRAQITYGSIWGRAQTTNDNAAYTEATSWARYLSGNYAGLHFLYRRQEAVFNVSTDDSPSWNLAETHDWVAKEGSEYVTLDGQRVKTRNMSGGILDASNPGQLSHFVFWANGVYPYGNGKAGMRLYSFTMQDGDDNTVLDLLPAINPNGVPGMWDKVDKRFFENSGEGAFIVGIKTLNDARMLNNALPVVPEGSTYSITLSLPVEASTDAPAQKALKDLADRGWSITVQYRDDEIPAGYAKVAFLESSGSQYIVTNEPFVGGQTGIRIIGTKVTSGYLWGVRPTNSYYIQLGGDGYDMSLAHLPYKTLRIINSRGLKCEAAYNFKSDKKMVLFMTEQPSEKLEAEIGDNWTYPTTDLPMMIFGMIHTSLGHFPIGSTRIYSFLVSQGSEITCNFIPVINTDGVPGMWDRVNKQFYENAGTGQFRVGLASKEAVRNLYLTPDVQEGTTIYLSVPAGTTEEDTNILKANNPNYTFNIQYRS